MKDLRNPMARARDNFLESEDGKRLRDGNASGIYLENRLVVAFYAGWEAAEGEYRTQDHSMAK